MRYIIAKHASEEYWSSYYFEDPGLTGLNKVYSANNLQEGRSLVKPYYETEEYEQAIIECKVMNDLFPGHGYAVVRLIEE